MEIWSLIGVAAFLATCAGLTLVMLSRQRSMMTQLTHIEREFQSELKVLQGEINGRLSLLLHQTEAAGELIGRAAARSERLADEAARSHLLAEEARARHVEEGPRSMEGA